MVTTLIGIGILLGVIVLLGLIMPKEMIIEKSISISRSLPEVYDFLKQTKNQDKFSVWNMADPNMKKEHRGSDGSVGFVYAWDSTNKNVGAGEQETKVLEENKRIEYELRFIRPMQNVAKSQFNLTASGGNQTTVMWGFYGPSKFPMNIMSPVFKNMLSKDLEKSLANLKNHLEK